MHVYMFTSSIALCVTLHMLPAENMRREGFELSVSPPVVVYRSVQHFHRSLT